MNVLFIPYGTEKAPATRYRVMQYLPYLGKALVGYRVFSAISNFSTSVMIKSPDFRPSLKFLYYVYVYIERMIRSFYIIIIARKFDIIFLQRTTFPFKLEALLNKINRNIVFDIDDAIYMADNQSNDIVTRFKKYIKEREVASVLRISKAVIVENDYIKDFVSRYCKNISKIPGPIDTERFYIKHKEKKGRITIGWIGSPATTPYLHMLDSVFKGIKKKYNFVEFKFIGLGKYENHDIEFEKIEWSYETEVGELQTFDIGVMPMPDDEWTRGKLGCKMLQYMAVGIPAVVSYTPTNAEIIKDKENGYFARTAAEWLGILSALIEDENLRRSAGEKGRLSVIEKCSLEQNTNRLIDIFKRTNYTI